MSTLRRPLVGRQDRLAAYGVALLCATLYVLTSVGPAEVMAGEVEFQSTSAFARTGSAALGGTPEADRIRAEATAMSVDEARYTNAPDVRVVGDGDEARVYGRHGVAQILVSLPFYALGRVAAWLAPDLEAEYRARAYDGVHTSEGLAHLAVGLKNPLLGAGIVWLVAMCALRLGVARGRAMLAAGALATTTYLWPQARSSLSDVQATFFLLLAFHLVLASRERFDRLEAPSRALGCAIGLALTLAFLSRVAVVPACLFVAAAGETVLRLGYRRLGTSRWAPRNAAATPQRAVLVAALVPVALGVALFFAANRARFGVPYDAGYGNIVVGEVFDGVALAGFIGLWCSPGGGLLFLAPLVLLVPVGLLRALGEGERLVPFALLGVVLLVCAPAVALEDWHGDSTYGPRYLLPALPFLWLFVALALEESARQPWIAITALGLGLAGAVVTVAGVIVDHGTHEDLAYQAAHIEWPDAKALGLAEGSRVDAAALDRARNMRIHWDPRFAAPFAHWRIFRHRVAGLGERFPVSELYFVDHPAEVAPASERLQEFHHFAWREFVQRFDGTAWIPAGLGALALLVGLALLVRGLDRTAPF